MTNFRFLTVALLSVLFAFTSCKKDPVDVSDIKAQEVLLSRKTDYGDDWIYFSFFTGAEVDGIDQSNYKTSENWDIAFNRYDNIRTNSGKSGSGKGGVYDAGEVDFSSIASANETGYVIDGDIEIVKEMGQQGPVYMTSTGNATFDGCITFSMSDYIYSPNNHIYVIKTAKGKYAKILFKSFYNDSGESGYLSFKYSYQNGDGRKFE